jgi:hypothetical protein
MIYHERTDQLKRKKKKGPEAEDVKEGTEVHVTHVRSITVLWW